MLNADNIPYLQHGGDRPNQDRTDVHSFSNNKYGLLNLSAKGRLLHHILSEENTTAKTAKA